MNSWQARVRSAAGFSLEVVRELPSLVRILLHEILGNPFRPVAVDPSWLVWNDGTVVKMAQAIYDERAFDRLPVLADALEEAGCTNADILAHCRLPGDISRLLATRFAARQIVKEPLPTLRRLPGKVC